MDLYLFNNFFINDPKNEYAIAQRSLGYKDSDYGLRFFCNPPTTFNGYSYHTGLKLIRRPSLRL